MALVVILWSHNVLEGVKGLETIIDAEFVTDVV
jgi:hypothetical protein